MAKQQAKAVIPALRAGEGTLLDVFVKDFVGTDGETYHEMGVSLAGAPIPERRYVADVFRVSLTNTVCRLLFGQQRIDGSEFRSLLIVQMSAQSAGQMLHSLEGMSQPSIEEIAAKQKIEAAAPALIESEPSQTVALMANMSLAAVSGWDACIDFYHSSPFAFQSVHQTHKLALDAVVRVEMPTAVLVGLMRQMQSLELPQKVRQGEAP